MQIHQMPNLIEIHLVVQEMTRVFIHTLWTLCKERTNKCLIYIALPVQLSFSALQIHYRRTLSLSLCAYSTVAYKRIPCYHL